MTRPFRLQTTGAVLTVLVLGTACASTTNDRTGSEDRSSSRTGASSQVITGDEILASNASNAWEAIRDKVKFVFFREDAQGNPQMATRRGNTSIMGPEDVRILLDGSKIFDLRDLLYVPAQNIREIRVLSAVDATTYFGTGSGAGAVLIVTR